MTPSVDAKTSLNRQIGAKLGTLTCKAGLFQALLLDLEQKIGYIPEMPEFRSNNANTALAHHSKQTFALVEVDLPFKVKVEKNPSKFDIES